VLDPSVNGRTKACGRAKGLLLERRACVERERGREGESGWYFGSVEGKKGGRVHGKRGIIVQLRDKGKAEGRFGREERENVWQKKDACPWA
jgi:hypothetical protein